MTASQTDDVNDLVQTEDPESSGEQRRTEDVHLVKKKKDENIHPFILLP